MQSHDLGLSPPPPANNKSYPTSGERLIRGDTKFDFTVDEGKGRLNPSRDKCKHRRRKAKKSFATPAGASTSLASRIDGMTTQTHRTHR